jgi:hypothetical protein
MVQACLRVWAAAVFLLAGCTFTAHSGLLPHPPVSSASPSSVYSSADASVLKICGSLINEPAQGSDVPWFRDATTPGGTQPILALASRSFDYGASPWVLVSHDCVGGVDIKLSPSGYVIIADAVYSSTHRYVAIRLRGLGSGTVTIIASRQGKVTLRQQIDVTGQ